MNDNVLKKIQVARTQLLLDSPFFGVCALQLKLVETPPDQPPFCPTAWTDGTHLGYNPEFIEKLTPKQLIGLIAHEVMHCACGHPWRRDSRDPIGWNVAADFAINDLITKAGMELPKGCLIDNQFEGKWAEWIYDRLPPPMKAACQCGKSDPNGGGWGEVKDAPGGKGEGEEEADGHAQTEQGWKQLAQQAAQAAKVQGKLPDNLKRMLGELLDPKVDWRSVLRRFVQQVVSADYSYRMPNRRYIAHGLYLPTLYSEACGRICVMVDTSGSIDGIVLNKFAAELRAIAQDVQPSSIDVIYCDAAVSSVETFARGELLELHPQGGGGTDFRPAFREIEKMGEPPVCAIYLTDLYGTFPDSAPEYPVIWATISALKKVPFGELVEIND